jgi:hypothetical protein
VLSAITISLADAVDGALDLPGARPHRSQRVRHRHAQVVVAVDGDHRAVNVRDVLQHAADQAVELVGRGVADRVGDVHRRGACGDDSLQHAVEVLALGARGVHRRELDIGAVARGALDHRHGLVERALAGHAELPAEVDVGGREESVDAGMLGLFDGLPATVNVLGLRAREARDDRPAHLARDAAHRLEVVGRRDGEARLDDVHAQPRELLGDLHLLVGVERGARRLLAVAQSRVEDNYPIHTSPPSAPRCASARGPPDPRPSAPPRRYPCRRDRRASGPPRPPRSHHSHSTAFGQWPSGFRLS